MTRLVEIGCFDNPVDAHMLLDLLGDSGIDARIFDEHTGSALPHVGAIGVRVVVRAEDAARAQAAIAEEKAQPRGPHAEAPDEEAWRQGGEAERQGDEDPEDEAKTQPAPRLTTPESAQESAWVGWAWRTRALAFLGVATFFFAAGVLFRLAWPPAGIGASARASRLLRQARWIAWITIAAYAALAIWIWVHWVL